MLKIDPQALYTRSDLGEMLTGTGLDPDTFIARLRPRKKFKAVWFGEDLLEALRKAPTLSERSDDSPIPKSPKRGERHGRGGSPRGDEPGEALLREFSRPGKRQP